MTVRWSTLLALIVCFVLGQQARGESFPRKLATGAEVFRLVLADRTEVIAVRVSLDKLNVRVLTAGVPLENTSTQQLPNPERRARGYSLEEYLRRYDAMAVLSGGYIDSYSPPTPLGFVKSDGVVIHGLHRSWLVEGLFCSDAGRARIILIDNTDVPSQFRDCVQAGPVLLLGGAQPNLPGRQGEGYARLAKRSDEQTFVCISERQEVVLGVTSKMRLEDLVATLKRPEFLCVDAIRMTAWDSAGLQIGDLLYGKDAYLFPSAIGVLPR